MGVASPAVMHVEVGQRGEPPRRAGSAGAHATWSPVSSVDSRTAASHGVSPGSRWPPGCSHRPSRLWRCRTTPLGPMINDEPVTWVRSLTWSNGRARRPKATSMRWRDRASRPSTGRRRHTASRTDGRRIGVGEPQSADIGTDPPRQPPTPAGDVAVSVQGLADRLLAHPAQDLPAGVGGDRNVVHPPAGVQGGQPGRRRSGHRPPVPRQPQLVDSSRRPARSTIGASSSTSTVAPTAAAAARAQATTASVTPSPPGTAPPAPAGGSERRWPPRPARSGPPATRIPSQACWHAAP